MCIDSEQSRYSSAHVKWLAAMSVCSLTFWFVIIPVVLSLIGSKSESLKFWISAFFAWLAILLIILHCYLRIRKRLLDEEESRNLIASGYKCAGTEGSDDPAKKGLGLLAENEAGRGANERPEQVGAASPDPESIREEKPRKGGLISRLSVRRKDKPETEEAAATKIIPLPDFTSENSWSFLLPYASDGCEHLFAAYKKEESQMASGLISERPNLGLDPRKDLAWDSRKPKDLKITIIPESETEKSPREIVLQNLIKAARISHGVGPETHPLQEVIVESPDSAEEDAEHEELDTDRDKGSVKHTKILRKSESCFLLESSQNKCDATSEIYLSVDECGRLEEYKVMK